MKKVLLLFSAGKESVYSLHWFLKHGYEVGLLIFEYGQKSLAAEAYSMRYYAEKYNLRYMSVPLAAMFIPDAIREGTAGDDHVIFRNGIFLSHALNIAVKEKYSIISFGATKNGSQGDASDKFYVAFKKLLRPMYPNIKLMSPTARYSGYELFGKIMHKDIDSSHLWSCMTSNYGLFCGKCSKCQTFIEEFESRKFSVFLGYDNYLKFAKKFYGLQPPE